MKNFIILLLSVVAMFGCKDDKHDTTQGLVGELSLNSTALAFETDGGTKDVVVTSNGPWRLVGDKQWCTPSAVSGKSGDKVTFTAVQSPDTEVSREVVYTFICGDKAQKLKISQKQIDVFEFLTSDKVTLSKAIGTIAVQIKNNVGITCTISEDAREWLTEITSRSVEDEWFLFKVGNNAGYDERSATLTFKGTNGEEKVVTLTQEPTYAINVVATTIKAAPAGEMIEIEVNANVDLEVSVEATAQRWIVPVVVASNNSRGLTPSKYKFQISAATAARSGKITFKNTAKAVTTVVTITQSGANPTYVTVPDANFVKFLTGANYMIATDEVGKFEITETGLAATTFNLNSKSIASIVGIEAFTNLTSVSCTSNRNLKIVDLSKNLKLKTYTPSKVETLINLGNNLVTTLSLRQGDNVNLVIVSTNLTTLDMMYMYSIETLDLSACPKVNSLNIEDSYTFQTLYLKEGQEIANIRGDVPNTEYK